MRVHFTERSTAERCSRSAADGGEQRLADPGYRLLTLGFDWSLLQRGAAAALASVAR